MIFEGGLLFLLEERPQSVIRFDGGYDVLLRTAAKNKLKK